MTRVRDDLRTLRASLTQADPQAVIWECWFADDEGPRYTCEQAPELHLTLDEIDARHAALEAAGADVYSMILSRYEPPAGEP